MANQGSFVGGGDNDPDRLLDQAKLLDQASAEVSQQAFYMKRAIESGNLREALKYSSGALCELRTSMLSPKNYYELYMRVFSEMQNLSSFFDDKPRHGRKMLELYESVQHAGNIVPRLYLLATVAPSYIKSKEAPAKEILKDVNELCKGVQHPIRGLFLRYYLSQMVKDKLPDTGSEYEGEGGGIDDAFEFVFSNFCESNKLWVRMQHQGTVKDKQKREKERYDLRVLVGANLVRMSQLDGMSMDYYEKVALPKLLDHVISVKDKMSQEYLFESIIQVFPDDFHIRTLEQVLTAYTKALPAVDMKPIMVTLMNRLSSFISNADEGTDAFSGVDIFSLFRTHLQLILERALEPATGGGAGARDIAAPLEVQSAFLQFTVSMYPDRVHYVDIILGSTVEILQKYFAGMSESGQTRRTLEGNGADKVVDLLSSPLKSLSVSVLDMEHYPKLMSFLNFETRKQVAVAMINVVTEDDKPLSNVDTVTNLLTFITPLIKDEDDTTPFESYDKDTWISEQQLVCKLVHQVRCEDTDVTFQMLSAMRGFFGQGGPNRMAHTLIPTYNAAMSLIPQIRAREQKRQESEEDIPAPAVSVKKVFQFMHKTNTALKDANAEASLQLWLSGATMADQADRWEESRGLFEPMCYEFMTQALICFEEEISDSMKQYQGIYALVGAVSNMTCLEAENYDTISQKVTQHGARLLKKPLQCRAVATCSHLFWCNARRDGKRVLECLQKCLKITDGVVQSDPKQVVLWVEMLDKYIFYFEDRVEEVTIKFIEALYNMCIEHINFAKSEASSADQAGVAIAHLKSAHGYLRRQKASKNPEAATRFADLQLEDFHL